MARPGHGRSPPGRVRRGRGSPSRSGSAQRLGDRPPHDGLAERGQRRLRGGEPSLPEEGDWPAIGRVSEAAWRRDRKRLGTSLTELLEVLAGFREQDLDRTGGSLSDRDPALGTGVTLRAMVHGLVQHNAYHSGQIALLRRALRTGGGVTETRVAVSSPDSGGKTPFSRNDLRP